MKETKFTYCRICEPNCGIEATLENGEITKITGDKAHPVSRGYMCPRGLATLKMHQDPDRLDFPQKKVRGKWRRINWDDASNEIGEKIKNIRDTYGPHSIGVYFGNPLAFDFAFSMYMPLMMMSLQTRNIYSAGSQDCNNKFVASEKIYGSPLLQPIPDIDEMELLIILGSNPAISHMSFVSVSRPVHRLRHITERGGRVVIIDPRRTETAKAVGEHLYIRPDTDIFLLLAMLHVIISEGLYSRKTTSMRVNGFQELEALAANYPPEKVASVTGIPAEVISRLARDLAETKKAGIHASLGINLGSFGTLTYWLVQCLNAITGHLDRRGSLLFCQALVDFPKIFNMLNKGRLSHFSRIGGFPAVMDTLPAGVLADEIITPGEGQIRALIVISGNPLLTVPASDRLEKAMKNLDLVVSIDFYQNETGAKSDYLLPATDFYERWDFSMTGMMFGPVRFVNYTDAVVPPKAERRHTWRIMHDIFKAAQMPMYGVSGGAKWAAALDNLGEKFGLQEPLSFNPKLSLRAMLLPGELSWSKLRDSQHGVLLKDHETGDFFRERILTPDKRLNLAPSEFINEAKILEDYFAGEKKYKGLKLIGQRQRITHNSWFHNFQCLPKQDDTNYVSINPQDARKLKVKDGDLVEVKSAAGRIKIQARLSDDLTPGVVSIPHGWGHDKPSGLSRAKKHPGVNVNKLMAAGAENLEKFAGMTKLTGVRVTIKKIST